MGVMHLNPVEQESIWDSGKQIVKQEKEGVKVVVSYNGRFDKYMVFDVEVFNNTNQPLSISPTDFTLFPLDENRQNFVSKDGKYIRSSHGIEPQQQIKYLVHAIANQEAKIRRASVLNTVLLMGGIAALIAGSSQRSESGFLAAQMGETVVQITQIKRIIDHGNYMAKIDQINRAGKMWSQENFKTSTLLPGQSLRVGVFCESNQQAKFVQFTYKRQNEPISFMFEQWIGRKR
jgi:hypothetical protein